MDKDIYLQKILFFNEELEKIEKILSNQMAGTGILLTIAGLLSFLPQLIFINSLSLYLQNFLSWTFWLLLVAIITYYPASLRVSSIVKGRPFGSIGSEIETSMLKNNAEYLELVWRKSVGNHDSVILWNGLTKCFIYAYIFSLIFNLYVFIYYGSSNLRNSITILIISILIAIILFIFPKFKSQKNKVIGGEHRD